MSAPVSALASLLLLVLLSTPALSLRYSVKGRLARPPDVPAKDSAAFYASARVLLDGGALVVRPSGRASVCVCVCVCVRIVCACV